jgi:hypothetical protein
MDELGIDPSELFMPSQLQLARYPNDPDVRRLIRAHHNARIDRLCARIAEKREQILESPPESKLVAVKRRESEEECEFVRTERRRLERARELHRREAENVVLQALAEGERTREAMARDQRALERLKKIKEEREQQAAEAQRRHLERMQELEEQERRRVAAEEEKRREQFQRDQHALELQQKALEERLRAARESEKRRQEKSEQNRQHLEAFEEERRQKIAARWEEIEKREARRIKVKAEERERMKQEQLAEQEKREALIKNAKMVEARRIEQKRKEGNERERKQAQNAAEYHARLEKEQKEFAERQRLKSERTDERRKVLEEDDHKRKEKQVIENEDADARYARILKHREETAAAARNLTSDNAVKALRTFEEWKQLEQKKRKAADEELARREKGFQKVREDQRKQNLLRAVEAGLKREERDANARHIENLKARQNRLLRERQENDDARIQKFKEDKEKMQVSRIHVIAKLADERSKFDEDFRATMHTPNLSETTIKKFAQKFNMDLEELAKRVQKRPGTAMTPVVRPQTRQSRPLSIVSPRVDDQNSSP